MTHDDRVWHHEMETLEGIHEHAERIASLEELAIDMLKAMRHVERDAGTDTDSSLCPSFAQRMRELGMDSDDCGGK